MNVIIDKIIQKVSDRKMNRTKYKVKRLKTVSGIIHAVIADIKMKIQKSLLHYLY